MFSDGRSSHERSVDSDSIDTSKTHEISRGTPHDTRRANLQSPPAGTAEDLAAQLAIDDFIKQQFLYQQLQTLNRYTQMKTKKENISTKFSKQQDKM